MPNNQSLINAWPYAPLTIRNAPSWLGCIIVIEYLILLIIHITKDFLDSVIPVLWSFITAWGYVSIRYMLEAISDDFVQGKHLNFLVKAWCVMMVVVMLNHLAFCVVWFFESSSAILDLFFCFFFIALGVIEIFVMNKYRLLKMEESNVDVAI